MFGLIRLEGENNLMKRDSYCALSTIIENLGFEGG